MKLKFSWWVCEKYSNIKIHKKTSSGRRVGPFGRTSATKLIDAFRNFANALRKRLSCCFVHIYMRCPTLREGCKLETYKNEILQTYFDVKMKTEMDVTGSRERASPQYCLQNRPWRVAELGRKICAA